MSPFRTVLVLAVLLGAVSPAAAQRPQTRHGYWIGFGWGYGSAGVSCDSCTGSGREGALSGYLKMGGVLGPHLLLGGESNGWVAQSHGTRLRGSLTASLYWYPWLARGHFLKAGAGFSNYYSSGAYPDFTGVGPGIIVGAGTDIRIGRMTSLTPAVNWFAGRPKLSGGSFTFPGGTVKQDVLQVVLGITFH